MKLKGKSILIRELSMKDLDDYFEYAKCPNVGPNAGWKPIPNIDICKKVLSGNIMSGEVYAIHLIEENKLIGTISLYDYGIRKYKYVKSIGYSINENYWNKGYGTEALELMVSFTFEHTDCEVLEVGHHSDNYRSKRVIEHVGFNYDGTLCKFKALYDGRLIDACFYSMTKEEYERKMLNERA